MTKDELFESVESLPVLSDDQAIRYVHTEKGAFYDAFLDGEYIAIGHNEVTIAMLNLAEQGEDGSARAVLIQKIRQSYEQDGKPFNQNAKAVKQTVTRYLNELMRFHTLKNNDIVVVPNMNAWYLSIGIVVSADYIPGPFDVVDDCVYTKRKRVEWVRRHAGIQSLHPKFRAIRFGRHACFDIKEEGLRETIRKTVFPVYTFGEQKYLTIQVNKEGSVHPNEIIKMLQASMDLLNRINDVYGLEEDLNEIALKLVVESPGMNSWIQREGGKAILLLGMISVSFNSCKSEIKAADPDKSDAEIEQEALESTPEEFRDTTKEFMQQLNTLDGKPQGKYEL